MARNYMDLSRRHVLASGAAISAAAFAGCIGGGDGDDGGDGGDGDGGSGGNVDQELYIAQVKNMIEFDPVVLNDVPSAQVSGQIFEGLYTYDDGTAMVPELAAGDPEVERDGERFIVELNTDARFQNDDPVTVEDVIYSWEVPVEEETENAAEVDMVSEVSEVDDSTVQFDLEYPFGAFNVSLGWPIVPKAVREDDPDAFNMESPVGSGPFMLDDWTQGESTRLVRWDDYWGDELPNLARVEFTGVEESSTRVTSLQTDENDVIEEIPPQNYDQVEGMDGVSTDSVPGIGYFYLAFNCKEGPTADPLVREAVDYCFDMDQAVERYIEPAGVRQYSPLPKSMAEEWNMPLDEWAEIPHGQDIGEAQALFDEAGVSSDYGWRIIVPPDEKREQIGISVSDGLKEAGFGNVEVQRLDWAEFTEAYLSGNEDDFNLYALGWSGSPDPEAFTYYLFAQSQAGENHGHYYENDEVDDQIVRARESADREEREELYRDAITTLLEDRVNLPAYNLNNSYAFKDRIEGFQAHPSSGTIPLSTSYTNVSVQ